MKRIIGLVLCIVMLSLALVSCGDEEHVHQYNRNEWKSDANNHWYGATCECDDAGTKNLAPHVDSMNDGWCDICGYLMCANTAYKSTYSYNDVSHWIMAECGHEGHISRKEFGKHDGGACSVCGYVCPNTEYKEEISYDEENHWYEPACGHTDHLPLKDLAAHVDKDKNEEDREVGDGYCDTCGYQLCEVKYEDTYSFDEDNHWFAPTCDHVGHELKGLEPHQDLDENGVCDICVPVEAQVE